MLFQCVADTENKQYYSVCDNEFKEVNVQTHLLYGSNILSVCFG